MTIIKCYVLHDRKNPRTKFFLYLGSDDGKHLKWMIKSMANRLPIRSGTWFEGFAPGTMIESLNKLDYVLEGVIPMPPCTIK